MGKNQYLKIGTALIPYSVVRTTRKKSIGIEVKPGREIVVRAPRSLSHGLIRELLESGSGWINKRIAQLDNLRESQEQTFPHGDQVLFLGKRFTLRVLEGRDNFPRVQKSDHHLTVYVLKNIRDGQRRTLIKASLTAWYRWQAGAIIAERVACYARQVGVSLPALTITNARRRWGSCGVNGRLNFPWRLVMAPLDLVDYVVVHELCHLKRRDHSPAFWQLVGEILPDFRDRRKTLRRQGVLYDL